MWIFLWSVWFLFVFKVLQAVDPIKDEEVVLGQYEGYKDDPTVPDTSNTPTFATVVLRIHNERWEGVTCQALVRGSFLRNLELLMFLFVDRLKFLFIQLL